MKYASMTAFARSLAALSGLNIWLSTPEGKPLGQVPGSDDYAAIAEVLSRASKPRSPSRVALSDSKARTTVTSDCASLSHRVSPVASWRSRSPSAR